MRQETGPVIRMVKRPFLKPANEEGLNVNTQKGRSLSEGLGKVKLVEVYG